jgi:hypothetical protein
VLLLLVLLLLGLLVLAGAGAGAAAACKHVGFGGSGRGSGWIRAQRGAGVFGGVFGGGLGRVWGARGPTGERRGDGVRVASAYAKTTPKKPHQATKSKAQADFCGFRSTRAQKKTKNGIGIGQHSQADPGSTTGQKIGPSHALPIGF